jgi:ABC-type multidrug transport system fused ATPase/permease subunit
VRGLAFLLATTALSVLSPWVLRYAVDDLTRLVTREKLLLYAGLIVGVVVVEGVLRYSMRTVLIGLSREIEYELRNDLFAHLARLSARYYQGQRIGDLMSRASNDLSAVRMVLGPGIMYTANTGATFLGTIAIMSMISPVLLGLSLVPLLFVSVLVWYFGRRIHDRFEAVQEQLSSLTALVQENLSGARVVRAYAQEAHELERFAASNREFLRRNRRLIRMFGSLYPGIQLLMGTGAVMVLWIGGRMVVAGTITLGEFVAFGAYLTMLHWPMIALGWVVNIYERGEASMGRIRQILEAPPEIRDEDPAPLSGGGGVPRPRLPARRPAGAARHQPARARGRHRGRGRAHGVGQEHAGEPRPAPVRRSPRHRLRGRPRRAAGAPRPPARLHRLRAPGELPRRERGGRRASRRRRGSPSSRRTWRASPAASTPSWASAASRSRGGRSSAPPWRAPWPRTPAS